MGYGDFIISSYYNSQFDLLESKKFNDDLGDSSYFYNNYIL